MSEWLLGPGEKWLMSLHEIGESKDEAEQLKRDHDQLEHKMQEIQSQICDLKQMADELINPTEKRSVDVLKQCGSIESLSKSFMARLKHQMQMVQTSSCFHGLVEEVSSYVIVYNMLVVITSIYACSD